MGHLERVEELGRNSSERRFHFDLVYPELLEVHPVEARRQATQGGIPVAAHLGQHGLDRFGAPVGAAGRARQYLFHAVAAVAAAEIKATKTHDLPILLDPSRFSACRRPPAPPPGCHDRPMPSSSAELSSLATALDELTHRVTAHADAAHAARDEETARELFAIERALTSANRRLARLSKALGRR